MERRLLLVRHCESEANRAGVLEGYPDAPLTDLGREQALRLRHAAPAWGPIQPRLVTSPLRRALDTAAAIGEALGVPPVVDLRLLAGEGRVSLDREAAGAEVAAAVKEGLGAGPGDLVAVTHRFPLASYLRRLYGPAAADRLMPVMGNGDAIEIVFRDRNPAPPRHLRLA